jgi:hypothetical protein
MADATHFGLGYGTASLRFSTLPTTWAGVSIDSSTVLIELTSYGDADLDGDVDVADLGRLATRWQTGSNRWSNGDFDYNGTVDVNDLGLLATNWQAGIGSPPGPSLAQALASLGLPNATVPEPIGLGLVCAATALMRRRRPSP